MLVPLDIHEIARPKPVPIKTTMSLHFDNASRADTNPEQLNIVGAVVFCFTVANPFGVANAIAFP
jgi:hypothetical protein